jgi:exopolyphosphatase/guanosine-5'-triphosphate,3'-diphosphate pyrophosphatase
MTDDQTPVISGSESLTPGDEPVLVLMNRFDPDPPHAKQVMLLSARLFDELKVLHEWGSKERRLLCIAALLHDIGWSVPAGPHHTSSMQLILSDASIPLSPEERCIVALIARYHRKAHPSQKHGMFASIRSADRNVVRWNAAFLRIADALDRPHRSLVRAISVTITKTTIQIRCKTGDEREVPSEYEEAVILKKAALLDEVSGRKIEILWN